MTGTRTFPGIKRIETCSGDIPEPRVGAAMLTGRDCNSIYLFGGRLLSTGELTNDLYRFESQSSTWYRMSDVQGEPPEPRSHHAMCYIPSRYDFYDTGSWIMIIGGCGELSPGDGNHARILDDIVFLDVNSPPPCWKRVRTTGQHPPPGYGHQTMYVDGRELNERSPVFRHRLAYPPMRIVRLICGYGLDRKVSGEVYDLDLETWHWSRIDYEPPSRPITSTYDVILADSSWLYWMVQYPLLTKKATDRPSWGKERRHMTYDNGLQKLRQVCEGMGRTQDDEIMLWGLTYVSRKFFDLHALLWSTVSLVAKYQLLLSGMSRTELSGGFDDTINIFYLFGRRPEGVSTEQPWPAVAFNQVTQGQIRPCDPRKIRMIESHPGSSGGENISQIKPPEDAPMCVRGDWLVAQVSRLGKFLHQILFVNLLAK